VLNATGLRIYRLDDESQTLVEVASSGRLPSRDGSPRQLPLSYLPWHRLALDSRRTQTIAQNDPESVMGGAEAALAMDTNMKTGCVVPIIAAGRPLGVIDVVEQRHPDRNVLDNGSKLILETLASMLAHRWSESSPSSTAPVGAVVLTDRLKGWSRQVVNPLTSIIGSVELIRHKEPQISVEVNKYLGTIERSATRIHESLQTIMTEAAESAGESSIPAGHDRWTWSRAAERGQVNEPEFARPASLSEAVQMQVDVPSMLTGKE
jgi:signal transduction histidine kinase